MRLRLETFLSDETGTITLDWVVLTAALVGTGISVMTTMTGGVETASVGITDQMRGHVIRSSFGGDTCQGGIAGLQAREDRRVASSGEIAIDVADWMRTYHSDLDDGTIVEDYRRLSDRLGGTVDWTREHTLMTALECEMVLRGLD